MKKWLYLIIVLLISCTEKIQTEIISSYPNGNKKEVNTFKGDTSFLINNQMYFENGQLASEFLYAEDGKTKNYQTEYYDNGSVKMSGAIKNDQRNGVWKAYFSSGELQTLANYNENGQEEGMYKVYAKKGTDYYLSFSGYYKEGERRGVWNFYNEKGEVVNSKSFAKSE